MSLLSPSTYRTLGLGTSALFIGLGVAVAVEPYRLSQSLGITPAADSPSDPTVRMLKLLGARDLAIGVALSSLLYKGYDKQAGMVLLSGMVFCAADVWSVIAENGVVASLPFGVASVLLGEVGWALLHSS